MDSNIHDELYIQIVALIIVDFSQYPIGIYKTKKSEKNGRSDCFWLLTFLVGKIQGVCVAIAILRRDSCLWLWVERPSL